MPEPLFTKRGGYRRLDTFMLATLIYYATVAFCRAHIASHRQQEQMTQAARSGRQNIAEGSERSATSTETEIQLTDVARASLAELQLDYEDYINLAGSRPWRDDAPESVAIRLVHLKRLASGENAIHEFSATVAENRALFAPWLEAGDPLVVANALVRLCTRAGWLLRKQLDALGEHFVEDGGFKERMTRVRVDAKRKAREPVDEDAPQCPQCGQTMRLRSGSQGPFWGCNGYPECRATQNIDSGRSGSTLVDSRRQESTRVDRN